MNNDYIMGHNKYYLDTYEYSYKLSRNGEKELIIDKEPNDISNFFHRKEFCPFCKSKLQEVFNGTNTGVGGGRDIFFFGHVFECMNCGWWTYDSHFSEEDDYSEQINLLENDDYFNKSHAIHTKE